MLCGRCEYKWVSKVEKPKECPRCKNRLDKIKIIIKNGTTRKVKE